MDYKSIDEHVDEMVEIADQLIPMTHPLAKPHEEMSVDNLKQRSIIFDGYEVSIHYSRADYDVCRVESLEIIGVHVPFLPMYVVCKLASIFLGGHELKYSESFKKNHKIYLWTIAVDERGRPIPLKHPALERQIYDHFSFFTASEELL